MNRPDLVQHKDSWWLNAEMQEFWLSGDPKPETLAVFIFGLRQMPGKDYTLEGSVVRLSLPVGPVDPEARKNYPPGISGEVEVVYEAAGPVIV